MVDYSGHGVQLNVDNKRAWCYLCKAEVILCNNTPRVTGVLGTRLRDEEDEAGSDDGGAGKYSLSLSDWFEQSMLISDWSVINNADL